MATTSSPRTKRPRPTGRAAVRQYLPMVVIVLCLGVLAYACSIANTGDPSNLADRYPEVNQVFPPPESEVLRQAIVGVDLAPGYGAVLYINGTRIPEDQVNVQGNPDFDGVEPEQFEQLELINRYQYQPLQGRVVEVLNGDRNCVRAEVFRLDDPDRPRNVEWCFTAA